MADIDLAISQPIINVDITVPTNSVDLTITGVSPKWGSINGTLSTQTDLQTALDAKLSLTGGTMTGSLTVNNQIFTTYSGTLSTGTDSTYAVRIGQDTGRIALGANASGNFIQSFGTRPLVFNSVGNNSFFFNKVGIAAQGTTLVAPTHSLTLLSTADGIAQYNTSDTVTNYERFRTFFSSNIFNITGESGGTGTTRQLRITAKGNQFDMSDTAAGFTFTRNGTSLNIVTIQSTSMSASSGTQVMLNLTPTIAQSGTAGYYGIYMNLTESSTGSGTKRLVDLTVGGTSKFIVTNAGAVTAASTSTLAGITNTGTITSTGTLTNTGTSTLNGDINAGTARATTTSAATTAPNTLDVINQNVRGFSNSLAALAGQPDYFYNADRNPTYTATSNYGTVGNLFNGDLTSNLAAPVASLPATPLVIEIARTDGGRINYTDVLTVVFTGHRLTSDGAVFTDYTVETKNSDGSYSVVLNRTGVSESVNLKSVPLHVLGDVYPDGVSTYHGIHGIRLTVSGAVASSFSAGNLQLNSIQLRDSRPQFTPATGIGALDTRGGSMYGDISAPSTSGTKLGTTSSQKLGFWNATPIAQPTTAVAAAAFVASAGTAVNDASTFDGYTIKQVVKALRNEGLLA